MGEAVFILRMWIFKKDRTNKTRHGEVLGEIGETRMYKPSFIEGKSVSIWLATTKDGPLKGEKAVTTSRNRRNR